MTERISVVVKVKGCPLALEGQAWLLKNQYGIITVSYEHCYEGDTLLTHHLTKGGVYIKTVGCEDCKLKGIKKGTK